VNVRRRAAAGHGQVLEEQEAPAGALSGRLERHRVTDDPEPFALARADRMPPAGDCWGGGHDCSFLWCGGGHDVMLSAADHERHFICFSKK
jgi:hypothetical protein